MAGAGETITVSYQVTNDSAVAALATWSDRLYFSETEDLEGSRFLLQFSTNGLSPLGPGESYQVTQQFSLPTDLSGEGFLLFEIDNGTTQLETDETDNLAASPLSIPSAELEAVSFTAQDTAVSGDSIDVTWTVANNGPGSAVAAWNDSIYLSTDDVWDEQDTLLDNVGSSNFVPLADGADYEQVQRIDLRRAPPGDYYLILYVDANSRHQESDEANNFAATPISLSAPNLVASDLIVPTTGIGGETITAEWSVTNDSLLTAAGNWSESVFISDDEVYDETDLILTDRRGSQLLAGEDYTQSRDFQLRGGIGQKYLLLVVDSNSEQGETNESDNVIARPINVLAANLTPTDFAAPANAAAGSTISATWTVENDSDQEASSQWYDSVYLSSDESFDSSDRLLTQVYQGNQSPLSAGSSYVHTADLSLSGVAGGSKFLLLVTDARFSLTESDETDNVRAIPIEIGVTNLITTDVTAPTLAASGETITVNWTTQNSGAVATNGNWNDSIYLSRDPLLDAQDQNLRTHSAGAQLAPGESYSNSNSDVRLSRVPAGDYYILVATNSSGSARRDRRL